jgi:hypothetical protein
MDGKNSPKTYRDFNPKSGYPAAKDLFYECLRCSEIVPSLPIDSAHCQCRNIMIDVDYGRVSIQDPANVKLFSR